MAAAATISPESSNETVGDALCTNNPKAARKQNAIRKLLIL